MGAEAKHGVLHKKNPWHKVLKVLSPGKASLSPGVSKDSKFSHDSEIFVPIFREEVENVNESTPPTSEESAPPNSEGKVMYMIDVPSRALPGMVIKVRMPDRGMVKITVPDGALPGTTLEFELPPLNLNEDSEAQTVAAIRVQKLVRGRSARTRLVTQEQQPPNVESEAAQFVEDLMKEVLVGLPTGEEATPKLDLNAEGKVAEAIVASAVESALAQIANPPAVSSVGSKASRSTSKHTAAPVKQGADSTDKQADAGVTSRAYMYVRSAFRWVLCLTSDTSPDRDWDLAPIITCPTQRYLEILTATSAPPPPPHTHAPSSKPHNDVLVRRAVLCQTLSTTQATTPFAGSELGWALCLNNHSTEHVDRHGNDAI